MLAAVLIAISFGPVIRGWGTALYYNIRSVIGVIFHLLQPLVIMLSVYQHFYFWFWLLFSVHIDY